MNHSALPVWMSLENWAAIDKLVEHRRSTTGLSGVLQRLTPSSQSTSGMTTPTADILAGLLHATI